MRYLFLTLALTSLSGCALFQMPSFQTLPDGVSFVKSDEGKGNAPGIAYKKYVLDNGLTVILHQDKSDPLVHVDMTYHVGSARENPGQTGFAHFFEHMMFQGSKHVPDQGHFKMITGAGGSVNGTTNRDRTNYYQTVPANELEKILWLESDRMGFLLDAVSQKKFEIQRDTVKNERAQNFENRPYGLVSEMLAASLYPKNHPYSWSTIGNVEDLNRVDVSALKAFFLKWYAPNNATLTIGGDIDISQTLAWIQKYFSEIPRSLPVPPAPKWPIALKSERFVTLEDKIEQPMLLMVWPTEYSGAENELAIDMLASVLGQGRNSLLYQALVKPGTVLSASAYQDCAELACSFQIQVLGKQGQDLKPIRNEILKVLDALQKRGIKPNDLLKIKKMAHADAIFSLQSVQGKVSQLASNEIFYNEPDVLSRWLKELELVSTKNVERVFDQYIWRKPSLAFSVVPMGQLHMQAHAPNYSPLKPQFETNKKEAAPLKMRTTPITFDRAAIPVASKAVSVKMPDLYYSTLENGIQITGAQSTEIPTVALHLIMPAGVLMEPKGKNGLASLTARLLSEGTKKLSSEEIAEKLDLLGSSIQVRASQRGTTLSLLSLTENLSATVQIAAQMLRSPRFKEEDFNRLKKQTLESIQMNHLSPLWLGGQARREVLYQDLWSRVGSEGSRESVSALTLEDVKGFYAQNYTPDKAHIIVVGDIEKDGLLSPLRSLSLWKGAPAKEPQKPRLKTHKKPHIWLVDVPNAPQSLVQMVRHGMPYDATGEMFKTQLANFNLSGNFNSRLSLNLREDKGFTYGAAGWLSGDKEKGEIVFLTQVRAETTLATIKEIQAELTKIKKDGLTDEEIVFLRLAGGQKEALSYETPLDKAVLIANIFQYALPVDYKRQQREIIGSVTQKTLNKLATKWFDPNDYQIIVVGDAKSLKPQLQSLGLTVKSWVIEK